MLPQWSVAEFLVITGLSGAGRSQAGAVLEDLGWFVMDNMPTALITKVAELVSGPAPEAQRLALVVGRHAGQLGELQPAVAAAPRATGELVRVLFLEASDEVLVRRFEGTRRRHPLGGEGVVESIVDERRQLGPIQEMADVVVDTSDLNVNQLRERLAELFSPARRSTCRSWCSASVSSTGCRSTSTTCSTFASSPTPTGWSRCVP